MNVVTPAALAPRPGGRREHVRRLRAAPGDGRRRDRAAGRGRRGGVGQRRLRQLPGPATSAARTAGRRALGRRRGAEPVLLRRRARAQARAAGRVAAPTRRCGGAGGGRRLRGRGARRSSTSRSTWSPAATTSAAGRSRAPPTSRSRWPCSPSSGPRLPTPLRAFLLTLAVVDDLVVIVIIAVFYTDELSFAWLRRRAGPAGGVRRAPAAAGRQHPGLRPAGGGHAGGACTRAASTPPSPASRSGCSPG